METGRSEVDTFNITDVTLDINPDSLTDAEFRDSGVTVTIDELEPGQDVDVAVANRFNPIDELSGDTTANDDGVATFEIQSAEELEDIYVGTYSVVVTEAGSDVQLAAGSFEVTSESPRVNAFAQNPTDDGAVRQGEILYVTGYNATPENTVTIDYGIEGIDAESVETDENGQFGTEFEVPEDAAPGVTTLTLTDEETGVEVTTQYTVAEADGPLIELNVDATYPGEDTTVEGERFTPNADTEISINPTLAELEADEDGNFVTEVTIPEDLEPGDYTLTVANQDNEGESASQSFEVLDPADRPQIELEDTEVYQGEELELKVWNLTADGNVEVEWNPTETFTADANGEIDEELPIAEDAEPGVQTLTVTDMETGEWNSVEYTVLEAADEVDEPSDEVNDPALTIDPERIELDDFIGDPEDGAGVRHVVDGLEPGTVVTFVITGPENVRDLEQNRTANGDGVAVLVVSGSDGANSSVYLGEYNSVATYVDDEDETQTLTGAFTVVDGDDSTGDAGGSDDVADNGGSTGPVDLNGTSGLAQTGANGIQLGLLAGGLLLAGGALLAFANRKRLFGRTA